MKTRNKLLCLHLFFLCAVIAGSVLANQEQGLLLFKEHCSSCHGLHGEGSEAYPDPLIGNLSINQLAHYIDKTMPDGDPSQVTGKKADLIAKTIHSAFYSIIAQEKNKPQRLDLSRLTVRQMQESLADIIGSFRNSSPNSDQPKGLCGEYFDSRTFSEKSLVSERIDPRIAFSFGTESPIPEQIQDDRFSIRWEGSVIPPETGRYEFIVRTDQAVRVFVNEEDSNKPLIDATVKSGDEREYRAILTLLGGRSVPIRVEFSKGRQGVAKQVQDEQDAQSFIDLLWRPPHGVVEVIPERCLSPKTSPEVYVLTTSFPPDDASLGYERGSRVSQEWLAATTAAAIDTADYCLEHADKLARVGRNAPDRKKKLEDFASLFAKKAFRRPLSQELHTQIVSDSFSTASNLDAALRLSLLRTLTSPLFLYHGVAIQNTELLSSFDTSAKLSFGLWDSIPDKSLESAAQSNKLVTDKQIRQQAYRMLKDNRAKSKVLKFLLRWLNIQNDPELVKDKKQYSDFSRKTAAAMRTSLLLGLEDIVWGEESDFRRLFTDDTVFVDGTLAPLFGVPLRKNALFQPVQLDDGRRAGIITHPYVMSVLSYADSTSPIHRGVFLARGVLGNVLKPPTDAVAPLPNSIHPDLTTRDRVAFQTRAAVCQTCHTMINPLGFALEEYDAIGRFRETEMCSGQNKTINAEGSYQPRTGKQARFNGGHELGQYLASSRDVSETFVQNLFHALAKQPIRAWGNNAPKQLTDSFISKNYSIRELIVEIAVLMTKPTQSNERK
jgi:cytochrome c553